MIEKKIHNALLEQKNVLVTGERGVGKTTALCNILLRLDQYQLIATEKRGELVYLHCDGRKQVIARRQDGQMMLIGDGFKAAEQAIERFISSEQKLLVIDEVGFLEKGETRYLNLIIKAAQTKQVLLIHRKENYALADRLDELKPYISLEIIK